MLKEVRVQTISVSHSRSELDEAADNGCVVLSWLRWHLYERIANQPSPESDIFLVITSRLGDSSLVKAIHVRFVDWGVGKDGRKGKGTFGPLSFVSSEGMGHVQRHAG
jgi:hypothetical protein